jgi:hypothetical protein
MTRISWTEWETNRDAAKRRLARIARAFPRPYRRERPRDAEEASLLSERGTPESLIGPEQKRHR